RAYLTQYGNPSDGVTVRDDPAPEAPKKGQVLVDIVGASINPAELLLIQGLYASKPPLPAPLGIEGAGKVVAIGDDVTGLSVGDLVLCLPRENWAQQMLFDAAEVIALPAGVDPLQASMLKVNPATALMMLRDMRNMTAGDWVVQNAANSAVGRCLIRLAKTMGLNTINLVRRESLVADLKGEGADVVLVDGPDIAARVKETVDGNRSLAIDAVGGEATLRLADCLSDEGLIVNYGLLSGQPCQLGAEQAIFRSISLRGFWLAKELRTMAPDAVRDLYRGLAQQVLDGHLAVPVEATYTLNDIGAALDHAMRDGRDGKILLTPNA
ncbi:MAG: zinc-dependent alcohol dehydrogenase family protein, partial [Burkholderiaceae bacterium]